MKEKLFIVKKGIRLHYVPSDKFTSNTFTVHFLAPLTQKGAPLANLLAKVLKKGCAAYPSQEAVAKRSEELYASGVIAGASKIGEVQSFFMSFSALDNRFAFDDTDIFDGAFSLFFSLLLEPLLENGAFSGEILERERRSLLDRISAQINNKGAYAAKRCREIMCEKEAYRFSLDGNDEDVEKISSAELYSFYTQMLSSAPIEIYYIGKGAEEDVFAHVCTLFDAFSARESLAFKTEIISSAGSVKRVTETADAVQGKLVMGFRTGEESTRDDFFAFMLFDAVYGASPVSKLFMNVREKLSLCYYCSSATDLDKGVMFVYSGVENENKEKAEAEILKQLNEICQGAVSEAEMQCAKASLIDNIRSVWDNAYSIERFMLTQHLRESEFGLEDYIERISALAKDDVVRAAKRVTLDTVYFLEGNGKGGGADA